MEVLDEVFFVFANQEGVKKSGGRGIFFRWSSIAIIKFSFLSKSIWERPNK